MEKKHAALLVFVGLLLGIPIGIGWAILAEPEPVTATEAQQVLAEFEKADFVMLTGPWKTRARWEVSFGEETGSGHGDTILEAIKSWQRRADCLKNCK